MTRDEMLELLRSALTFGDPDRARMIDRYRDAIEWLEDKSNSKPVEGQTKNAWVLE
ncbi:hypothetical protein LVJ94_34635 [Pendulispora rubella]|uniref:Uncharacterized protein n=1 Tax=Pendulispora rubella TaxID=2741070 RepID=A0ABZ2L0C5_9BACT